MLATHVSRFVVLVATLAFQDIFDGVLFSLLNNMLLHSGNEHVITLCVCVCVYKCLCACVLVCACAYVTFLPLALGTRTTSNQ